ncbi:Microtubule-binding calmodulin-regulated spectrin-associated protein [Cryptosporidium felis]|nr:Microtubule-binding calmodulin-regulated spectrin-associated protein [Cryptosporidium felis]
MRGQFGYSNELPYINLERIEELRRLQHQYGYYFRDRKARNEEHLGFGGLEIGGGCMRARKGLHECELYDFGEDNENLHARSYGDSYGARGSMDICSGKGCCRSPFSHSRHFGIRNETRDDLDENRCVICNSSLDGGPGMRAGGGSQRSSRIYSYYNDCLGGESRIREFQEFDDNVSEFGSLPNTQGTTGGDERHLEDDYSDLSDDMEIVINRNNRKVISLALNWISLSGEHNRKIRKFVTDSMESQELKEVPHFVILFQYDDHKGIRGMYTYFKEGNIWQCVIEISPNCPKVIQKEMIHTLYKFDTCQKLFKPLKDSKKITDIVDGLSIKNEYLH